MKKLIITAALMIPLMGFGQSTFGPGTIGTSLTAAGAPHNFADQTWNPYVNAGLGGQICQPCHTPHNAITSVAPLWNHASSIATYDMYTKEGGTAALQDLTAPDGFSALCLSCHDGSVALGSFGGQTGTTFIGGAYTYIGSGGASNTGANFGTDLRNDHPISITYNTASTSRPGTGFVSTYTSPNVYTATTKMLSGWLEGGTKVQCTSCHGPHRNTYGYQLKQSNQGSAICINCHAK